MPVRSPSGDFRDQKHFTMRDKSAMADPFKELETFAAELIQAAGSLPATTERHNILVEIEKFRQRIAALKTKRNNWLPDLTK